MGPRPKRKLEDSDDREYDENLRNIPTAETQELYNTMRELEDGNPLEQHVQIQSRGGVNEHSDYLRPPSQAPSLPPASPASTTQSINGALADVEIHDDPEHQPKKRRAVRHGSLEPPQRARAALMRKLGACKDCKARKVKCDHFDKTLFEQAYQAKRQQKLMSGVSAPIFETVTTTPVTPISQPNNIAFSGLGDWQNFPSNTHLTAQPDEEISLDPPIPSTAGNRNIVIHDNFVSPYSAGLSPTLRATPSVNTFPQRDPSVPIGRRTATGWECRHGSDDGFNFINHCTVHCIDLRQLLMHFETMHDSFVTETFKMWKCIQPRQNDPSQVCGFMIGERSATCDGCRSAGNAWEEWRYGTITRTPSLVSDSSYYRVPSRDGSMNSGAANQQFLGSPYGQYNDQMLFPGRRFNGGGQAGSHHSYGAAKSVNCFRGIGVEDVYPRSCPYGGTGCLKQRWAAKLGTKATLSLVMVVVTMLSIGLMPTLSVQVNTKQGVGVMMLEATRNHVLCMPLVCVAAGLAGMWLFRHVQRRLGQDPGDSCHQRCLARDLFGMESKIDVEDAGSMRGDEVREILA